MWALTDKKPLMHSSLASRLRWLSSFFWIIWSHRNRRREKGKMWWRYASALAGDSWETRARLICTILIIDMRGWWGNWRKICTSVFVLSSFRLGAREQSESLRSAAECRIKYESDLRIIPHTLYWLHLSFQRLQCLGNPPLIQIAGLPYVFFFFPAQIAMATQA